MSFPPVTLWSKSFISTKLEFVFFCSCRKLIQGFHSFLSSFNEVCVYDDKMTVSANGVWWRHNGDTQSEPVSGKLRHFYVDVIWWSQSCSMITLQSSQPVPWLDRFQKFSYLLRPRRHKMTSKSDEGCCVATRHLTTTDGQLAKLRDREELSTPPGSSIVYSSFTKGKPEVCG